MAIVKLFKIRAATSSCQIVLASGNTVKFVGKRAFTQDKAIEKELEEAAGTNNFGVYIDKDDPTIDTTKLDPAVQAQEKAVKDLAKKHGMTAEQLEELIAKNTKGVAVVGVNPQASTQVTTAGPVVLGKK